MLFGLHVGISHVDLHEKAIELRFGQWIGTFLLEWILRCQNMKWLRQVVALARDGDVLFLHGLQQCGLGAWTRPIDFVRHQQLRENRAAQKAEGAPARIALFEDLRSDDVGRHEIWRKLNPFPIEAENGSQRLDEPRLGKPRKANEETMPSGE